MDIVVSDTEVRYDVWRDTAKNGTWEVGESWNQAATEAHSRDVTLSFQQGVNGYTGTSDTMLTEGAPDQQHGGATTIGADTVDSTYGDLTSQSLIHFDDIFGDENGQVPEWLTSGDLVSAVLMLNTTNPGSGATAHRMTADWTDADTWNSMSGGIDPGVDAEADDDFNTGADTTITGTTFVDVTESLREWLSEADPNAANKGWALLPLGTNGWDFNSAEGAVPPELVVTFAVMPGDFDKDGDVDVSDLGILTTHYGTMSGMELADGDATGDWAVDANDLGILATNYGTGTAAAVTVPEPVGLALLLGVMPIMCLFRRR